MKKRYLLLIALVAAVLVLALSGTALAQTVTISIPDEGTTQWDIDTGATVVDGSVAGADFLFNGAAPNYGSTVWEGNVLVDFAQSPVSYEDTNWDIASVLTFQTGAVLGELEPGFVIRTDAGNYFKVRLTAREMYSGTFEYEQLLSTGPPALLDRLAGFIADPTIGTVDAEIAPSLTAKVNSALAALSRGNENDAKVAMNDLRALVNQVKAQTDKKISPAAAAEIIAQADAIVDALGY